MTTTTDQPHSGRPPMGSMERAAWIIVIAGAAVIAVAGFVNSFAAIETSMRPYFGPRLAWTVPLAVDIGILVFTALDLLMAYRDMRSWWLRHVPRGLIAVTVYLNAAGETDTQGRVAHAVLPLIWVIAVEVAGVAVRTIFGLRTSRARLDRIRRSRWLLDPIGTARLRRRMILREETSLTAALERDLAFELAKADMRETHGWRWRWTAPRRQRLLLRRGQVAPGALPTLALTDTTTVTPAAVTRGQTPHDATSRTPTSRSRRDGTSRSGGTAKRKLGDPELLDWTLGLARRYASQGRRLTARAYATELDSARIACAGGRRTRILAAALDTQRAEGDAPNRHGTPDDGTGRDTDTEPVGGRNGAGGTVTGPSVTAPELHTVTAT